MSSLKKYSGVWDDATKKYLLRRCLFGVGRQDMNRLKSRNLDESIQFLLRRFKQPDPPVVTDKDDPEFKIGETWIEAKKSEFNSQRRKSYFAWHIGQMLENKTSLREKMVLFWHNHFVTEASVVRDARAVYRYFQIFRKNPFGNFRKLTEEVTLSFAMLRYLNGDQNVANAPNENYARELFELFTIGKGKQIGEGNYTNYTEQDVKAAARVLTGWKIRWQEGEVYYNERHHDKEDKQFSKVFDNQVISNEEDKEYKALIAMIFEQKETARYLCRKLYGWFVYDKIDDKIEKNIIQPLADILYENDYEVKPVLEELLTSAHFFDRKFKGAMIKNPAEFTLGMVQDFQIELPDKEDFVMLYDAWHWLGVFMSKQEMTLGNPPIVAGWQAYYQEPELHRLWVNSATLPMKSDYTNVLISERGFKRQELILKVDILAIVKKMDTPDDPNKLIEQFAEQLFPFPIAEAQRDEFKEILIPGLPDFEWTIEWRDYRSDSENEEKRQAVENKLRWMLSFMLTSAEYLLN